MGCQLHYRHSDYILGKCIPLFAEKICGNKSINDGSLDKSQPLGSNDHALCSPEHGGGKIHKGDGITNHLNEYQRYQNVVIYCVLIILKMYPYM